MPPESWTYSYVPIHFIEWVLITQVLKGVVKLLDLTNEPFQTMHTIYCKLCYTQLNDMSFNFQNNEGDCIGGI